MSSTYGDLRKTEAEQDEQRRAALPQPHTPRNYDALKGDAAPSPKPEQFLPDSPIRNMTTEQVIGFEKARGNWDDAKAETYRQEQAARSPNDQLVENAEHTASARRDMLEQKAQAMPADEVMRRYEKAGQLDEARAFEKQQTIHANDHNDEARDEHRRQGAREVLQSEERAATKKALEAERAGKDAELGEAMKGKGYEVLYKPKTDDPDRPKSRDRGRSY
jgi:hypothetical protein